jgi:hypothetical protein
MVVSVVERSGGLLSRESSSRDGGYTKGNNVDGLLSRFLSAPRGAAHAEMDCRLSQRQSWWEKERGRREETATMSIDGLHLLVESNWPLAETLTTPEIEAGGPTPIRPEIG